MSLDSYQHDDEGKNLSPYANQLKLEYQLMQMLSHYHHRTENYMHEGK